MNRLTKLGLISVVIAGAAAIGASNVVGQQNGSIEFTARATPAGGVDEPVRGFPFYLLSESFDDVSKEADTEFPKPDLNKFIDSLDVSKELKDWMKKNQWVSFSGEDFVKKVKVDDVINVPEFYAAYIERNSGDQSSGFPVQKFHDTEKSKDPARYQKDMDEYKEAIRRYLTQVPDSLDGIDMNLADLDPSRKWNDLSAKRNPQLHRRLMELAQGKYLVARTQTNLQGQGFLPNLAPGRYWLSTLDMTANVGDARPAWDYEVIVHPGDTTYAALTNVNAVLNPEHAAP